MTAAAIVSQLESLGRESYKRVLLNHSINEPVFGVKIEELKKIHKRVKRDYQLALDLYATGIYDAQYLAGLIADETKMTKADLRKWLATANGEMIRGTIVAWVTAESGHGRELAMDWIESTKENTVQTGWATLSSLVAVKADADLDLAELKRLLQRVGQAIHQQPNSIRSAMNAFVIALGTYVRGLTELAVKTAEKIGPVSVDKGDTACRVPYAPDYIQRAMKRGVAGRKRKTARC
jgi:3-methyladenine DNA glycosylase AlkD